MYANVEFSLICINIQIRTLDKDIFLFHFVDILKRGFCISFNHSINQKNNDNSQK